MRDLREENDDDRYWCESGEYWYPYPDFEGIFPQSLDGRRYAGRNLLKRPWKDVDPAHMGVSDAELDVLEKAAGFSLPALYREHLKQQNGGYFHFESFLAADKELHPLFINDAKLDPISKNGGYTSFAEMCDFMDEDDWDAVFGGECKLERLYILSGMYGHSLLCLDYGCTKSAPLQEPEVCLFDTEMDFAEVFRVPSYADFIRGMVYAENEWHLGVKTQISLDAIAGFISTRLEGDWENGGMQARTDDHYGWYNYERWYSGTILRKGGNAVVSLLPNRSRAGTYCFEDNRDCSYILKIDPRETDIYANRHALREEMKALMRRLAVDDIELRFILPE